MRAVDGRAESRGNAGLTVTGGAAKTTATPEDTTGNACWQTDWQAGHS